MNFLTLLAIVLPAAIVTLTAYYLLKKLLDSQERKQIINHKTETVKEILPLRLQAYERIILMLERIRPGSLVFRVSYENLDASGFQAKLLENIRDEFEHNLSQQVYISGESWQKVVMAREETVKLINNAASQLKTDAMGNDLARTLFEKTAEYGTPAVEEARNFLKKEVQQLF